MSATVFANGMSIACKASSGKSIAAMPDVCLSPPSPPAGPLPIPYPNTAMASDTDKGSKTVLIGGQEVMLKDKSVFKKSSGNEAATKSFGMNVVTHQIQGEANFLAWSMDVKFEGENVPRHMDIMGHNEACPPTATPPWLYTDTMTVNGKTDPCKDTREDVEAKCTGVGKCDDPCKTARKCVLVSYNHGCCDGKTPHHVVPKSQFHLRGQPKSDISGEKYSAGGAPCVCEDGKSHSEGNHGDIHEETNNLTVNHALVIGQVTGKTISADARWPLEEAEKVGAEAVAKVTKDCDKDCIQAQARNGHQQMNISATDEVRPTTAGRVSQPPTNTTAVFE